MPDRISNALVVQFAYARHNYLVQLSQPNDQVLRAGYLSERDEIIEIRYEISSGARRIRRICDPAGASSGPTARCNHAIPSGASHLNYCCFCDGRGAVVLLVYSEKEDIYKPLHRSTKIPHDPVISSLRYSRENGVFQLATWSFEENAKSFSIKNNRGILICIWTLDLACAEPEWRLGGKVRSGWYPLITLSDDKQGLIIGGPKPLSGTSAAKADYPRAQSNGQVQPPYIWMQSSSGDIDITFRTKLSVDAKNVVCTFKNDRVECMAAVDSENKDTSTSGHILFKEDRLLGSIIPAMCTWTLENGNIFNIHLYKSDPEVHWPHLFAEDDYVDEALNPVTFSEIVESLNKYTSSHLESGNGPQYNASGERMEGVDADRQSLYLSRVLMNGDPIETHALTLHNQELLCYSSCHYEDCEDHLPSGELTVRSEIDAVTYKLQCLPDSSFTLTNTAAHYAMSYIQISKTDRKYTLFSKNISAIVERRRNVFIYYNPSPSQVTSAQIICEINTRDSSEDEIVGALLQGNIVMILMKSSIVILTLPTRTRSTSGAMACEHRPTQ